MTHRFPPRGIRRVAVGAVVACGLLAAPATANPDSARRVLKSMTDYMASHNNLSAQFDAELDIVTPKIEKIQFDASGDMLLNRPNKLRVTRKGGYSDIELIYDGDTATMVDRYGKSYARIKSPGSVDSLIDQLRGQYAIDMPGADLILSKSYEELMDGVIEANHIGVGVIDGFDCDHLAFRNADTDWQIWVRRGDRPLPCKYVITSKTVASAPQYSIRFHNWKVLPKSSGGAFSFRPPAGSRLVEFNELANIGDLPPQSPPTQGARR